MPVPRFLPPLSEAASILGRVPLARLDRLLGPRLKGRLAGLKGVVLVCPVDAPLAVSMMVRADGTLTSRLWRQADTPQADAVIRAPLATLWGLAFGGGLDGDGSFFNRDLLMEGNTALAMALRYALEEAELTPEDVLAGLAPVPAALARPLAGQIMARGRDVHHHLRDAQSRLLEPLLRRVTRLEREVGELSESVSGLAARAKRMEGRPRPHTGPVVVASVGGVSGSVGS